MGVTDPSRKLPMIERMESARNFLVMLPMEDVWGLIKELSKENKTELLKDERFQCAFTLCLIDIRKYIQAGDDTSGGVYRDLCTHVQGYISTFDVLTAEAQQDLLMYLKTTVCAGQFELPALKPVKKSVSATPSIPHTSATIPKRVIMFGGMPLKI